MLSSDGAFPAIKRRLKRLPMIPQLPKAVEPVAKHHEQMESQAEWLCNLSIKKWAGWMFSHGRKHYGFPHNEEIILLFDHNEYTSFTLFKKSHSMEQFCFGV